jgi:uncharacterized SAM-binding protein YcdF (DUF218 family)
MDLFLSKVLPQFVYPLGLAIALGLLGVLFALVRFRTLARISAVFGFLIVWAASTPVVADWLYGRLEAQYPPVAIEASPSADAAILLGGVLGQPLPPRRAPDLGGAADRILHAARLFRAGKVRHIIVTAGNLPWRESVKPEANYIAGVLNELGVPAEAVLLETASRTTYENAVNTRLLMEKEKIVSGLLVTSAAHMPRAYAVFRNAGLKVTPSSTDVAVTYSDKEKTILDWMTDAGALGMTTLAMKEWLGMAVYQWRGWM